MIFSWFKPKKRYKVEVVTTHIFPSEVRESDSKVLKERAINEFCNGLYEILQDFKTNQLFIENELNIQVKSITEITEAE